MKTLIVYDTEGNIPFTQVNANGNYKMIIEDIPSNKEIAGVDPINNKLILKDSTVDKSELEKTQAELEEIKKSLADTQSALNELMLQQMGV